MIALFFTLQNNLLSMTCEEAFAEYKLTFNKVYSSHEEEKKSIFCANFKDLQELLLTDPNLPVGLVERMDVVYAETVQTARSGLNQLQAARNDYCSAVNPLPDLATVHPSVDLREMQLITPAKNQGSCGSCYMFQTMAVLENAVLRDKKNLNAFWQSKANSSTLSLSEQFQLSNAICDSCNYCNGGNFVIQTYVMVPGNKQQATPLRAPIQTVELTENFPYSYAANQAAWQAGTPVAPKLTSDNYLLPVKMLNNSGLYAAWCNQNAKVTPVVKIFDDDASIFNATTVKTIKSYLSRGIAVAASMLVGSGTTATTFQYYRGGAILNAPCTTWNMDHAVTFVGYGTKNGKNVWVLKNSWGTGWGDKGFFFIEIGSNSYCTEQFAYTVLPKNFDLTETVAYPRGTLARGTINLLDCDTYFTNISGVVTCYDACPDSYPTFVAGKFECSVACPAGQSCATSCQAATPFKEAGNCVARCSTGAYSISGSDLLCQASCTGLYILNASNQNSQQCITTCPTATPYYETGACVSKCTSNAYSVVSGVQTLMCQASCTYYVLNVSNSNSQQCLSACPTTTPYIDVRLCADRCASGAYASVSGVLTCQASCTQFYILNATNSNSKQCMAACPTAYFIFGQQCSATCPAATPYNDSATTCVSKCATGAYQVQGTALSCVASCPGMYIANATSATKQCITACPATTPYYQTGACVSKCSTGAYSLVGSVLTCQTSCKFYILNATNGNTKQCLASCTGATPYSTSGLCSARCSSGAYSLVSGVLTCQSSCSKLYVINVTNNNSKQCVTTCTTAQVLVRSECKPKCTANCMSPAVKTTLIVAVPLVTVVIVAVVITAFVCSRRNSNKNLKIKINSMNQNYSNPTFFAV
ncbi:Cathepsin_L [Hexamita inflata]|uniref:Cathepsin_L n=1 Tax=Hexamita inflata TaxID=28002 RepID=A0ABP1HSP8_9EUKA